ncbi:AraC family transcriptional regulator [Methylocapsa sp. S129]|uniref:helix-turn-helix transcriptional regulator n=1 Tax=Methylocapsa sp. S129 TaxID=1641869 RepID=UPI00131E09AE|nr:AraC family transcriptional regulator [Methylocapsa sp. S129]
MSSPQAAKIEWLVPAESPGVDILVAKNDQTAWHHFHETYGFCACDSASADLIYRGKRLTLRDGVTFLVEPGESHRNPAVLQPQNFKVVYLTPAQFDAAGREHGLSAIPDFRAGFVDDPHFIDAVYKFSASVENQETVLEQQSRLAICLRVALRHVEQSLPKAAIGGHRAITRVKECLLERFSEPVTLDELSALSGLSPFHLVRSFTRHVGAPPHAYQIRVRIERARTLLRNGTPPAEAAHILGFGDQSHFTRHFKKTMRVTPAQYARAAR